MPTDLVPLPLPEPEPQPPATAAPAVPDLVAAWLGGKSAATIRGYQADLADFAGFARSSGLDSSGGGHVVEHLLSLSAGEANAFVLSYKTDMSDRRKLSAASVSRRLAAIRSVVKLAGMLGRVTWTIGVASPRKEKRRDMRGPDPDELKAIKRSMKRDGNGPRARRDRAIVSCLYGLGLRRAEVAGLMLADVDFGASKLLVMGKGRREKIAVELTPEVGRDVGDWVVVRGSEPGPLFHRVDRVGSRGPLDLGTFNRILRSAGLDAGMVGPLRPHGLRRAAITLLFRRKKTLPQVTAFARHADPKTTMGYHDAVGADAAEMAREVSKDLD
jgi:integrase/recombinase XerC